MKIVINKCYGGFSVSEAVYDELGLEWDGFGYLTDLEDALRADADDPFHVLLRSNPELVAAVEKLGPKRASGSMAQLAVVDIPDDVEFTIEEYDGIEWIAEAHRTWG